MGAITTLTSREFNQDTSRAKRAASDGPVFITDRGQPAHVLLTIDEYRRLSGEKSALTLFEALAQPEGTDGDFDFEFERVRDLPRDIDLGFDR